MDLPEIFSETHLYQAGQSVLTGELSLEDASAQLIATAEWGNPSDGEINRTDTFIRDLIHSQRGPHAAYILAELNLAVCKAVGSPSQEVICSDTVGEAITGLKDPRLIARRIEVYEAALKIVEQSGDEWQAAILYNNLGNAYGDLTTGDLRANSKRAIEYLEQALVIFTPETQPYAWASIQNNLATIYKVMPGSGDENIRLAIAAWERALTVFSRDDHPLEWANVRRNLGIAYKDLSSGNPIENLALAEDHLLAALEVFAPEKQPIDWAETQNTLGNVYLNLTIGDRSKNVRRAISCFEATLGIRTLDKFPAQFAATCVNLGAVWFLLPSGDRVDNLRRAIEYYEQALTVYTPQDFPELAAQTHANLAAAYLNLPAGDRARNLWRAEQNLLIAQEIFAQSNNLPRYAWVKSTLGAIYHAMAQNDPDRARQAIACFQEALNIYTAEAFPADYARAMDALGTLYRGLSGEDRLENHRRAEQCYQAALAIYRPESYPDDFASTQTNLGNCYLYWPTSDRSQTLPKAIECYQRALSIHTRETSPLDYARLMDGLAIAYSLLADQRAEFRIAATQCFREALEAVTAVRSRGEIVRIAGNAGSLFFAQSDWRSASVSLATAIHALEEIWDEHYSPMGKSDLQAEHAALYARIVRSCHALAQEKEAFAYAERGRGRYLLSFLGETLRPPPTTAAAVREKLAKVIMLSQELRSLTAVIQQSLPAERILTLIDREESLREERNRFLGDLANDLPEYVALRHGHPLDFDALKVLLAMH